MVRPGVLPRFALAWRALASATRVRILLATLAAGSLALRDVLLFATSAALLLVYELSRAPAPKKTTTG